MSDIFTPVSPQEGIARSKESLFLHLEQRLYAEADKTFREWLDKATLTDLRNEHRLSLDRIDFAALAEGVNDDPIFATHDFFGKLKEKLFEANRDANRYLYLMYRLDGFIKYCKEQEELDKTIPPNPGSIIKRKV